MSKALLNLDRPQKTQGRDFSLIAVSILLLGLGLITLYSGSAGFARRFFNSPLYFFKKQIIFAGISVLLFLALMWLPLDLFRNWVPLLLFISLVFCLLTFVPGLGLVRNGAARWISLGGFSFQPSELAKLTIPLYLAHIFAKKTDRLNDVKNTVLPPLLVCAAFFLVIYLQNDFSTAAFIAVVAISMFFLSGVRLAYFLFFTIPIFLVLFLLIFTREYRVSRLINFVHPNIDPQGAGYQVAASIKAISSGSIWGKGMGLGTRKLSSVPEIHSDFIFAAFCEESGFVGLLLYLMVLVFFAWRVYRAAWISKDSFKSLMLYGLGNTIVLQSLLNLAVISGLLPATGIPLPFFSAGGSSLLITMAIAGLLVNASAEYPSRKNSKTMEAYYRV